MYWKRRRTTLEKRKSWTAEKRLKTRRQRNDDGKNITWKKQQKKDGGVDVGRAANSLRSLRPPRQVRAVYNGYASNRNTENESLVKQLSVTEVHRNTQRSIK